VAEEANGSSRDHGVLGALGEHKTNRNFGICSIEFSPNQLNSIKLLVEYLSQLVPCPEIFEHRQFTCQVFAFCFPSFIF